MLATPTASIVELATPTEVFTTGSGRGRYELRVCAVEPGPVTLASGFSVEAPHGMDELAGADTVIVPGDPDLPADPPPAVVAALGTAAARGARLVATGSGTFVLAAAGLLAGRRATTRHDLTGELRRRFPMIRVDTSALSTADDDILTCAGGAAAMDMCLEVVRNDHGAAVADTLVHAGRPKPVDPQAPVVLPPGLDSRGDLAELLDWATAHLDQPLDLASLARAARMSPRTLARRFRAARGMTPMQWLLGQRLRRAQHLLETTSEQVEEVARRTGFGSAGNFRWQFTRAVGVSPQAYRRKFRQSKP